MPLELESNTTTKKSLKRGKVKSIVKDVVLSPSVLLWVTRNTFDFPFLLSPFTLLLEAAHVEQRLGLCYSANFAEKVSLFSRKGYCIGSWSTKCFLWVAHMPTRRPCTILFQGLCAAECRDKFKFNAYCVATKLNIYMHINPFM